uniref:Uncharacterized protein n=1 Tax=Vespula pensylvanica TaxID=30213 RepID=A0A834PCT1_VESPE|nr:hypothetical protein H0235_003355 [Vespula pensylvanica]
MDRERYNILHVLATYPTHRVAAVHGGDVCKVQLNYALRCECGTEGRYGTRVENYGETSKHFLLLKKTEEEAAVAVTAAVAVATAAAAIATTYAVNTTMLIISTLVYSNSVEEGVALDYITIMYQFSTLLRSYAYASCFVI